MTLTEVWDDLCALVYHYYPDAEIHKQYTPLPDLEELADASRPFVWVGLASAAIESVNTNANIVGDSYTFRFIVAWKLRDCNNPAELDSKLGFIQEFLTQFRHKKMQIGKDLLYFGLPNCDSPYDEDLIISPGVFMSSVTVPVSTYRNLTSEPVTANNGENTNSSGDAQAQT